MSAEPAGTSALAEPVSTAGRRRLRSKSFPFRIREVRTDNGHEFKAKFHWHVEDQGICNEAGTTEQSYYRWRKEYGGLSVDQAKKLKQLETENGRLKKLVADLSLEKQVLNIRVDAR